MRPASCALGLVALLSSACGTEAPPPEASRPAPARPEQATEAGAPSAPSPGPGLLQRSATPEARLARDERECEGKNAAACRKVADRYRGYGHVAGCGVARDRPKPRRMVTAADARADAKQFDRWIRRACELDDPDACQQGKNNVVSSLVSDRDIDACARGALGECPLYLWVLGMHPDQVPRGAALGAAKMIEHERQRYLKDGYAPQLFVELFRKEKTRGGDTLPAKVADLVEGICKTTLECDDVFMMLDKNGYPPAALAPLRKTVGEGLTKACLEGDCVCGEAARTLDPADVRLAGLAKLGCDDGEPDACFLLGELTERGAGVEKNLQAALDLYEVACPAVVSRGRDRYSKAACDRLAEMYEEGRTFEKDPDRAYFYATLACTRKGFERDHAFCLRRGRYHGQGFAAAARRNEGVDSPLTIARDYFYGIDSDPVNRKECERPSVEAICKRDAKLIP